MQFSIILPIHNLDPTILVATLSSLSAQTYPHFDICASIARSCAPATIAAAQDYAAGEPRLKIHLHNLTAGISANSNAALGQARGAFVVLVDHDDTLEPDALARIDAAIDDDDADLYYTDRNTLSEDGTRSYKDFYKPGWSPELLLHVNYLSHLTAIRRGAVDAVGGWHADVDGAQDWDLFLRLIANGAKVRHVPGVLYHWRELESSTAKLGLAAKPYALDAQGLAVERYLASSEWAEAIPIDVGAKRRRIRWGPDWRPHVHLIVCGPVKRRLMSDLLADVSWPVTVNAIATPTPAEINKRVAEVQSDVIVLLDPYTRPSADDWLQELAGPLQNSKIAVTGGQVVDAAGRILEAGWSAQEGRLVPVFRTQRPGHNGLSGSASWYRNFTAVAGAITAIRRDAWNAVGGLRDTARPDLQLCLEARARGLRVLYNPYAQAHADGVCHFERAAQGQASVAPFSDPYTNPLLHIAPDGAFALGPAPTRR